MKAEIISVGTEILLGEILDTNAQYIASRLPALGIDIYWKTTVGDNLGRVREAVLRAWERSDLIIMTGGLGPTEDDLTREAVAEALNEPLEVKPELEKRLREFFSRRGYAMPERNLKQAWLIPSAAALSNARGTAPGWWVERDGKIIVCMPGVPHEMYRMWDEGVAPRLAGRSAGDVIVARTLKTGGIGEGTVDEMVSRLLQSQNPSVGVYARQDGVHLRIAAKAPDKGRALELIAPVEEEMRRILGPAVWGVDDDALEAVVGRCLLERGFSLATMESCTGGLLASAITDVSGSSAYFKGGFVAYSTEMKMAWGVDAEIVRRYGVISAETAREMARAARQALGAEVGVGITGVAGSDPVEGHPEGTVHIGLDVNGDIRSHSYDMARGRAAVKRLAVTNALQLLRRALIEESAQ